MTKGPIWKHHYTDIMMPEQRYVATIARLDIYECVYPSERTNTWYCVRYADYPYDEWQVGRTGRDGFFGCDAYTDVRETWGITRDQCDALAAFLAMEKARG